MTTPTPEQRKRIDELASGHAFLAWDRGATGQRIHRRVVDGEDADPPLGGAKHCVGHGVLP